MPEKRWIGDFWGSRVGTGYLVEAEAGTRLTINFANLPTTDCDVTKREPYVWELHASPLSVPGPEQTPIGVLAVEENSDQAIRGTYRMIDQAAGTFRFSPDHATQTTIPNADRQALKPSLRREEGSIGAITLSKNQLRRVIAEIEGLMGVQCFTNISGLEGSQDNTQAASDYLARRDLPRIVRRLTINCTEARNQGLKRIIVISLNDNGNSKFLVEAPDEIWTSGAARRIESFLSEYTSALSWLYKYGAGGLVAIYALFAFMIVAPDLSFWRRFAGAIFIVAILWAFGRWVRWPYTRVYLDDRDSGSVQRQVPAFVGAGAVAIATGLLKSQEVLQWLWDNIAVKFWSFWIK